MARLYVANCTKQTFSIRYRLEYLPNGDLKPNQVIYPTRQQLPSGRQIALGGDVSMEQVTSLMQQLEPFGALAEVEAKQVGKKHGRVPLVWNVEKPVSRDTMLLIDAHNQGLRAEEGRQRRLQAAIAADETLNTVMNEVTPLFEVEIETESVEVGDESLPRLEEGIHVDRVERGADPAPTKGGKSEPQKGRGHRRGG